MIDEIKNITGEKKELRNFAATFFVVFLCLAGLSFWRGKSSYVVLAAFSFIFLIVGLTLPRLLKPLHSAWMALGIILGWFTSRVILIFLYYLVITPIGLIAKLSGKNFLDLQNKSSYWIKKTGAKKNYEKQF